MNVITNIDEVRAQISKLENAAVFDHDAWSLVLGDLMSRPGALEDARRRMKTAYENQPPSLGMGGGEIELTLVPVAVETEEV